MLILRFHNQFKFLCFCLLFKIKVDSKPSLNYSELSLKSRVEVDRNSETNRRNYSLRRVRKHLQPTFPGFMSVAVFVTDQSKYTENFWK